MEGRAFARRIVSWYPGVRAIDVAALEGVSEALVRRCRMELGRGAEFGGTYQDTLTSTRPRGSAGDQLSLVDDVVQRELGARS